MNIELSMGAKMTTPTDNTAHLARLLKVIADESRLRILGYLAERDHNGKELVELLGLTAPTVSHHMRKLVDAGTVTATSDAQSHRYSLNTQKLLDARKTPVVARETPVTAGGEDEERVRVLRNFFEGKRLKSIPARRKQRVIVLQHLLTRFNPGQEYPESEVNDILRTAHDDVATLRRELVDYGFMVRDKGIYEIARSTPARSPQVAQEIIGDEYAWLRSLLQTALATPSESAS
jgi:DNA-binding HxlR family transcriptional regulator